MDLTIGLRLCGLAVRTSGIVVVAPGNAVIAGTGNQVIAGSGNRVVANL